MSHPTVYEAQVALSEACTNVFHHVTASENFEVLINIGDIELTLHILAGAVVCNQNSRGAGDGHTEWPTLSNTLNSAGPCTSAA